MVNESRRMRLNDDTYLMAIKLRELEVQEELKWLKKEFDVVSKRMLNHA